MITFNDWIITLGLGFEHYTEQYYREKPDRIQNFYNMTSWDDLTNEQKAYLLDRITVFGLKYYPEVKSIFYFLALQYKLLSICESDPNNLFLNSLKHIINEVPADGFDYVDNLNNRIKLYCKTTKLKDIIPFLNIFTLNFTYTYTDLFPYIRFENGIYGTEVDLNEMINGTDYLITDNPYKVYDHYVDLYNPEDYIENWESSNRKFVYGGSSAGGDLQYQIPSLEVYKSVQEIKKSKDYSNITNFGSFRFNNAWRALFGIGAMDVQAIPIEGYNGNVKVLDRFYLESTIVYTKPLPIKELTFKPWEWELPYIPIDTFDLDDFTIYLCDPKSGDYWEWGNTPVYSLKDNNGVPGRVKKIKFLKELSI